ncbi:MAG: hypothetical protein EON58_12535, partial [Alphaproteobacteria bacterium]
MLLSLAFLAASPLTFHVQIPKGAFEGKERVSVVVFLSKKEGEPRFGPDWFDPQPCYAGRFEAAAGETLTLDEKAMGFPGRLSAMPAGEYTVQAVIDRNLGGRMIGGSAGNLYSKPAKMTLDPTSTGAVALACTETVKDPELVDTEETKQVAIPSPLLSAWYKRPTSLYATVVLPKGYDGTKSYPTVYIAQGFGGTFRRVSRKDRSTERGGTTFVNVVLDANCPGGHSVFADSANNGPWGEALTTELIPALEKRFKLKAEPSARLLNGHSSGGWTSLWLQVAYPDTFGGTWSTAP